MRSCWRWDPFPPHTSGLGELSPRPSARRTTPPTHQLPSQPLKGRVHGGKATDGPRFPRPGPRSGLAPGLALDLGGPLQVRGPPCLQLQLRRQRLHRIQALFLLLSFTRCLECQWPQGHGGREGGGKARLRLWDEEKAGNAAQVAAAEAEGERSVPGCDGGCSRWVGEAECVRVSEWMGVGGRVCEGWDFPGPLTLEPRDAHPSGHRRSPALLAPWMHFIVFAQKETPSFPERKLFQDKKSITNTSFLALFLRPK